MTVIFGGLMIYCIAIKVNGEYTRNTFFNEVMIERGKRVLELIKAEIING